MAELYRCNSLHLVAKNIDMGAGIIMLAQSFAISPTTFGAISFCGTDAARTDLTSSRATQTQVDD